MEVWLVALQHMTKSELQERSELIEPYMGMGLGVWLIYRAVHGCVANLTDTQHLQV